MKRILFIILFIPVLLSAQDTTNLKFNPIEGRWDYISNIYPGSDTVINFGTNNTFTSDSLNGVVGHQNVVSSGNGISFGYHNDLTHAGVFQFGAFLQSDTTYNLTIGRGWNRFDKLANSKYGTIGLGYFSSTPTMYIHSGLEPGETWTEDIGGVSIGTDQLDTLTALQIQSLKDDGTSYLIKGQSSSSVEVFTLDDQGNMEITGTLTVDSVVCDHVPTIHQAAGDTSNYNTPDKIGDIFIDTSSGDSYMSTGTSRGDWLKLNFIFPFFIAVRRKWLLSLLLLPAIVFSQEQGRLSVNPITGEMEFTSNFYYMQDTLINFGQDNYLYEGRLNGVIGHNNFFTAGHGLVLGNNNNIGCDHNWVMGSHIKCFAQSAMTFGGGWFSTNEKLMNDMPGSIGFGFKSRNPALYIHDGYYSDLVKTQIVNQTDGGSVYYTYSFTEQGIIEYEGDIGGVNIGHNEKDRYTRLNVYNDNYILKTEDSSENDRMTVQGNGNASLTGTLTCDDFDSDYTSKVYYSAGDTTLFPTPFKTGDFYINTSDNQIYVSAGTSRGDWIMIAE